MVSLSRKTTTQSIIIGKLNAYARINKTRAALMEYDNIICSLYLLNYIDDPSLRRNVQKALNRIESYHQLRRSISFANFGKLRFKTEYEQNIWNECSRLLSNCVIFYNASVLSILLKIKEISGNTQEIDKVKQVSPIAWQHVNFCGHYEFTNLEDTIDIDEIIRKLSIDSVV